MKVRGTAFNQASEVALNIYGRVLCQVRADRLVHQAVQRVGDLLFIHGRPFDLDGFERIWIAGSGKASVAMAKAVAEILGERLAGGLVVTRHGHGEDIPGIEVLEAGHPVPDEGSLLAGERMLQFAATKDEGNLVIFLLSGGASALMEAPEGSVSLADLQATNAMLLASGADIRAINSLRSRISRLKAGGLAEAFNPATVVAIVLSDVVGNDLQAVGSGPLLAPKQVAVPPPSLDRNLLPHSVRQALDTAQLRLSVPLVEHFVIGSISLAIHAAADVATEMGLVALPYADPLRGEARKMARTICRHSEKADTPDSCMIFGGETTVTIKGKGLGGRCQEMATAAAEPISKREGICFLAAGTDGADGPTDAAGGMVDPGSIERAASAGCTVRQALRDNDSYQFLDASGGLIFTRPTDSNVNDLVLVVRM